MHGSRNTSAESSFRCLHCGLEVLCDPSLAGVQNRNHCPYCLWSRHLDARVAGDRGSGCRASMEPIGLTLKRSRNKYATERDGELMLVHRCTICAKVSINRIAADDSVAAITDLFARSSADAELAEYLTTQGIDLLTGADAELVQRRLFGSSPR